MNPNERTAWCAECDGPAQVDERGCIGCRERKHAALLKRKRDWARLRYQARKAKSVCIECGGQREAGDGVRCNFCHERDRLGNRGRRSDAHRAVDRARGKRLRDRRQQLGSCLYCTEPVDRGSTCSYHREQNNAANRRYRERKKLKAAAPPRLVKPLAIEPVETQYRPYDEVLRAARVRVLLAMRWLDWSSVQEICDVIGADADPESTERNTLTVALLRMLDRGLVERRGERWRERQFDYRLTADGVREADRIRNGGTIVLNGRSAA